MNLKKIKIECIRTKIKLWNQWREFTDSEQEERNSQNLFAGCTNETLTRNKQRRTQIFLFLSDNAMNFGCRCGSSYVHFGCCGCPTSLERCGFRETKKFKFHNVAKSRVARSCPTPDRKTIRSLPSRCAWVLLFAENNPLAQHVVVANLNEQNRVSKKNLSPKFGRDKKTGWHPQSDRKNHIPFYPLNYGQTPPEALTQ